MRYIKTTNPTHWHPSHAKNLSHQLATGEIICNIDADNFVVKGFAEHVNELFQEDVIMRAESSDLDNNFGTSGRIALKKEHFYAVNGYDEEMTTWIGEDGDLIRRTAQHFDIKLVNCKRGYLKVLSHTNHERAKFLPGFDENQNVRHQLGALFKKTSQRIRDNFAAGRTIANQNVEWGVL